MKISLNWIKDFVDVGNITPEKLGNLLTLHTAEVEEIKRLGGEFDNMVVGEIEEIKKHPNADKLSICKVTDGHKTYRVVCGATNIYVGMQAPFAKVGARVKWHGEGEFVTLEKAKIRGEESEGMLCAASEIGLEEIFKTGMGIPDLKKYKAKNGTPLKELFGQSDVIFDIDNKSLTHRPDLWGHYGMAREIAALLGKKLKPLHLTKVIPKKGKDTMQIIIKNTKQCPHYCGLIIKNIQIQSSPEWMKKRLVAIGQRPINNVVDATNYVMAELGQPMHAFDLRMLSQEIIVRNAKDGEWFTTLDGQKHKLDKDMLVIADRDKAVALAGIMGGQNSEISDDTTDIFIESANFEPYTTRITAEKLKLRTESSQRFEKSLDPMLAKTAIQRIIQIIQETCPKAIITSGLIEAGNWKTLKIEIPLNFERLYSKIGKKIAVTEIKKILISLEFHIKKNTTKYCIVEVPSHRATKDIRIEDDLIEEISRIHGYDKIEPCCPALPVQIPRDNFERRFKHKIRKILSLGLGFNEVYNYSFYNEKDYQKSLLSHSNSFPFHHVEVENPLSEEQTHLRISLLPNILKNVQENLKYFETFKIYEIGRIYKKTPQYMPEETKILMGVIIKKETDEIFYEAKGAIETLLKTLRIDYEIYREKNAPPYVHPQKHIVLKHGEDIIGSCSEISPAVLAAHELKIKMGVFEIDIAKLAKFSKNKEWKYVSLPKYPETHFDISVIVPLKTEVAQTEQTIQKADTHNLIKNIELFDIFTGEQIGKEKKAFAFKITLRADDRTLKDEEMTKIQQNVFKELQKTGGEIRGL